MVSLLAVVSSATPSAADTVAGAGPLVATVTYTEGGIPIAPHGCVAGATWNLAATSVAVVVQLVNDEYAGPLTITASGSSPCADSVLDFGAVPTAALTGNDSLNGSTIACGTSPAGGPLTGQYFRVGLDLVLSLQGDCSINGSAPSHAVIAVEGQLVPAPGVVPAPGSVVSSWDLGGAFALDVV